MNFGLGNKIMAFYEIDYSVFTNDLTNEIKTEINGKGKEYILKVDEDEFKKYLNEKYTLEPLQVDRKSETILEPSVTLEWAQNTFRERFQIEVLIFVINYTFSGDSTLFRIRPSTYAMTTADIYVNDNAKTVSFKIKVYKKDVAAFNKTKDEIFGRAFANMNNANQVATDWNKRLPSIINQHFNSLKKKYMEENDFFSAINVKIDRDTTSVFTAPTFKRKIVPQPTISKNKEFSSEPMMANKMYIDILKVIYDLGKSMERKPSTYQNRDEEGIRDQFLLVLETRYNNTTATGETFNRGGKTDIILKYAVDGSYLFVAECKFWHGSSEFLEAISQLFDRYLTWRDSKTALLIFVKNKNFTSVIQTIKTDIKKHTYYIKENGERGETSLSYLFHLPQDKEKNVYLEVMIFHFDK